MREYLLFTVLCVLFFSACSNDPSPFVVYDVEDEFEVILKEKLSPGKTELQINIQTLLGFSCENVIVNADYIKTNSSLDIQIDGIGIPANCNEGSLKASKLLDLGEFNLGEYDLTISLGDAVFNSGKLIVSDYSYKIEIEQEANGIIIPHNELLKIPTGTIWGRVNFDSTETSIISDKLISELEDFGAAIQFMNIGKYTNVEVNLEGDFIWDQPSEYLSSVSFSLSYFGQELDQLNTLISDFDSLNSPQYDYDFDIFTYQGEEY